MPKNSAKDQSIRKFNENGCKLEDAAELELVEKRKTPQYNFSTALKPKIEKKKDKE